MPRPAVSDSIKRIAKGRIEVLRVLVTLTPRQRQAFQKDSAAYLRRLFKRLKLKVNNFYITTAFEQKINRLLDTTPPDFHAQFYTVNVHVTGAWPSRQQYSVSTYL
jgi:hypothetical protein